MGSSFRLHGTTLRWARATRLADFVHQSPQLPQSVYGDTRALADHQRLALRGIQHPAGHDESQLILQLNNHRGELIRPHAANDLNILPKEWVKRVLDPCGTELMSSVMMCYDTRQRL